MSNEQRAVRRYELKWFFRTINCAEIEGWQTPRHGDEIPGTSATVVLATDYDALSTELAEAKAEIERMREALKHFAMLPLEEFGFDEKPDERPITGFNKWQLTVGHIRKARAALIPAKGKGE